MWVWIELAIIGILKSFVADFEDWVGFCCQDYHNCYDQNDCNDHSRNSHYEMKDSFGLFGDVAKTNELLELTSKQIGNNPSES